MAISNFSFGQKLEGNNWLFGDSIGLSFNQGPEPVLTDLNKSKSDRGPAAISDKNGNLLFYTDGEDIYNRNGQIMPNGTGISFGNRGTEKSSIISKVPGSETRYMVITIGGYFSFMYAEPQAWYTEVDITLQGGLGDVITLKKNIAIGQNVSIGMAIYDHSNGIDKWLILHKRNSTSANVSVPYSAIYAFYKITSDGISFVKQQIFIWKYIKNILVDTKDNYNSKTEIYKKYFNVLQSIDNEASVNPYYFIKLKNKIHENDIYFKSFIYIYYEIKNNLKIDKDF